jgi:hypothetical protein
MRIRNCGDAGRTGYGDAGAPAVSRGTVSPLAASAETSPLCDDFISDESFALVLMAELESVVLLELAVTGTSEWFRLAVGKTSAVVIAI